jgi:hypothetical protein
MGIRWATSADKHHIDRADALNAILKYEMWIKNFDAPRPPSTRQPDLFIGWSRDGLTRLEIMAIVSPPNDFFVFHVMPARRKLIEIAERNTR